MPPTCARVLIADDEELNLEFYEQALADLPVTVVKARDGVEALDKFSKLQPDVVVIDLAMPRLNGLEVCAHLRRQTQGHTVPILVLTGMGDAEMQTLAQKSGANDFLGKPITLATFRAHVCALLPPAFRPSTPNG